MKKTILFIIMIAGIFEGCKKYEDGPLISLRSAKNRIYGNHTLVKYTVNGEDSLSLYNDSLSLIFIFDYYDYDDLDKYNFCLIGSTRKDNKWSELYWKWNLDNKNKTLNIYQAVSTTVGTGPFGDTKLPQWEILKLKKNNIQMKTNFNGKEYFIELN